MLPVDLWRDRVAAPPARPTVRPVTTARHGLTRDVLTADQQAFVVAVARFVEDLRKVGARRRARWLRHRGGRVAGRSSCKARPPPRGEGRRAGGNGIRRPSAASVHKIGCDCSGEPGTRGGRRRAAAPAARSLNGGREPLSGHLSPDPVPHLVVGDVGIKQDSGQLGQQGDLVVGGLRPLTAIPEFAAGPGPCSEPRTGRSSRSPPRRRGDRAQHPLEHRLPGCLPASADPRSGGAPVPASAVPVSAARGG